MRLIECAESLVDMFLLVLLGSGKFPAWIGDVLNLILQKLCAPTSAPLSPPPTTLHRGSALSKAPRTTLSRPAYIPSRSAPILTAPGPEFFGREQFSGVLLVPVRSFL
jgi:hypothetical protein